MLAAGCKAGGVLLLEPNHGTPAFGRISPLLGQESENKRLVFPPHRGARDLERLKALLVESAELARLAHAGCSRSRAQLNSALKGAKDCISRRCF